MLVVSVFGALKIESLYGPVMGVAVGLSFFRLVDVISPQRYLEWRLIYLAAGVHLVFAASLREATHLSIVFSLIALRSLIEGSQGIVQWPRASNRAAAFFSLAVISHGSGFVSLLAGILSVAVLGAAECTVSLRQIGTRILRLVAPTFLVVVSLFIIIAVFDIPLYDMHARGGADDRMLIALFPNDDFLGRPLFFSHAHFAEVANNLLAASPLVLLCAPFVVVRRFRGKGVELPLWMTPVVLAAGGFLGFISVWGFDLGYPADYDLMMVLSLPFHVLMGYLLIEVIPLSTRVRYGLIGVFCLLNWLHLGGLTRGNWMNVMGYPLSGYATIKPDGMAWDDPTNIVIEPGELAVIKAPQGELSANYLVGADCDDTYRLVFYRGKSIVFDTTVNPTVCGGIRLRRVAVPGELQGRRFDTLEVKPSGGDSRYSFGYLVPMPSAVVAPVTGH